MLGKKINTFLTLCAFALVIYGIYTMTTKKEDKKDTKDTKDSVETKFDYKKELDLVNNFILADDFEFNNELKMRFAISNVDESDYKKTDLSFNDINYYEFSGYYVKVSTLEKYLKDLFGSGNYELKSFYDGDSYYLYDKSDKNFYIFYSTLVTNCVNDVELATNCIDIAKPYCEVEYKQDGDSIKASVGCVNNSDYIKAEKKEFDNEYSYQFIYKEKNNDYYISEIKLIKE